ncbi:MAG TPA: CocE/NonD family hydrolase [Conexibacter sp.]|nr:CocE/NonD family hydrolase [Conexibacter sp.]
MAHPSSRLALLPMADGTQLATAVALPHTSFRGPTLLVRTPYEAEFVTSTLGLDVDELHAAGFAVVGQDVRGRGASGGSFGFLAQEHADGRATLAWIAAQPWSDGRVVTAGNSYLGRAQLMLGDAPELVAMIPGMAGLSSRETWWPGGVLDVATAGFWLRELAESALDGVDAPARAVLEQLLAGEDPLAFVTALRQPAHPLREAARVLLPHLDPDGEPNGSSARPPRVPSLHITGWFDPLAGSTIATWEAARAGGSRDHHLLAGPWTHATLGSVVEDVEHPGGGADELTLGERQLGFMSWYVHGSGERPPLAEVYVTGANRWRSYDLWPPPCDELALQLGPAGELTAGPVAAGERVLASRAADPVPSLGGTATTVAGAPVQPRPGPTDVTALAARPDVLAFAGAPLAQAIEVAGTMRLSAWVSADPAPAGLVAKLADRAPGGTLRVVADGVCAEPAACDDDGDGHEAAGRAGEPRSGEPIELRFALSPVHHRFGAGHRVVLLLCASELPRYALGLDRDRTLRVATGPPRPARLVLPVVREVSA